MFCGSLHVRPFVPFLLNIMLFVARVARRILNVEQEMLTLSEPMSSPPVFSGICVARSLVFCVLWIVLCLFVLVFLLDIVLYVLLRFTSSDYPFFLKVIVLSEL